MATLRVSRRTGGLEICFEHWRGRGGVSRRTGGLEKRPICQPYPLRVSRRTGGLETVKPAAGKATIC